ncbi:hypothetical protein HS088_TW21G01698 [Tripterygium wilfordii]|uniref:KIB1-4 beta-propeller domain-containing protein n=2 Tax=Tripterygium wilfordii TaxID=458696 RepID=A0A7J7C5Y4_TRIWF|nr:hypothetical protein HS088_TW21G01698 [Tripterygium wilfordii]
MILKKHGIQNYSIPPPLPYPWIISRLEDGTGDFIFRTTTPPYESRRTSSPDLGDKEVRNCCYGWLIFSDRNYDVSLWNPLTSELIHLPPIESKPLRYCFHDIVLSSSPSKISTTTTVDDDHHLDPNTMVFLFDSTRLSIIYCTLGEKLWNTVCYAKEIPPELGQPDIKYRLCKAFILNGSLYARGGSFRDKLLCIHQVEPTHIGMRKYCDLPWSNPGLTLGSNHLVESYGELFYIAVSKGGINRYAVVDIEVFKFNQESMRWHKVRRAKDRVFLVGGKYSISYLATGEIKGGFIYIERGDYFYIYNSEDQSLSIFMPHLMCNIPRTPDPILFMPDLRLFDRQVEQDLDEAGQSEIEERETIEQANNKNILGMNEGESKLFGFPVDLLVFITRLLNPVDYINLRTISKTCRSTLPQIQWREPSISLPSAPLSSWFIFSYTHSRIHSFVDSRLGGRYLINIPDSLVDTEILHSNDGWLLMSIDLKALSFYNPFTKEIIKLPNPPRDFFLSSCIGFSSSPKSRECLIVAIGVSDSASIYIIRLGEEEWHHYEFDNHNHTFDTSHNSPVFYDGAIYVLGQYGNLGVFELLQEGQMTWKVLHKPKRRHGFVSENFLIVCDEKLLLVLIGEVEEVGEVKVFKLNRAKMSWKRVRKLDSYALYVSRSSSFSTLVKANGMGNRIFIPRLHGNGVVNYSLKTRKYHCFSRQDDLVDYYDTRELLHASWIEPSWS